MRKRISLCAMLLLLVGAVGCASNPNVEGAKLDLRNENYDKALKNVNKALDKNPKNATALRLKGDILANKADTTKELSTHSDLVQQSIEAYDKALKVDPSLKKKIRKSKRYLYAKEFRSGAQAFKRGKSEKSAYGDAATYFKNAAAVQPDSASAFINRAFSLLNAGESQQAISPMKTAIEKGADDVRNYRYLARLYRQANRPEDAIALLEEAQGKYPEDSDVQSLLLNAYVNAGQTDRAMDTYQAAVDREPDNKLYRYNFGSLLLKADQYDRAIEQLQRAVKIDPSYADAQYNLGATYVQIAVDANDSLRKVNDWLRGNRDQMSEEKQEMMNARMKKLVKKRETHFSEAIPPLEKAYKITKQQGEDTKGICQALFQAYVQTGKEEKAQSYSSCAGYEGK